MALTKATEAVVSLTNPTFAGTTTLIGPLFCVTGSASVAPIKLFAGPVLTTPVAGSIEFDGTDTYITNSSAARKKFLYADATNAPGTGTIFAIGISGNAATVTNGVVTTGAYSDPSWLTSLSATKIVGGTLTVNTTGSSATCTGNAYSATYLSGTDQINVITGKTSSLNMLASDSTNNGSFVCKAAGTGDANLAGLSFSNDSYSVKLGIRADGQFGIGGWTAGAWKWYVNCSTGDMTASGNVTAYSDPRLKLNFNKIQNPLSLLSRINGGSFTWKDGISHTATKAGKNDYGVLADQIEAIMPEIVSESIEIDGVKYKTVAYDKLIPLLIEAIKELNEKVDLLTK
jgi:hypothetical protein